MKLHRPAFAMLALFCHTANFAWAQAAAPAKPVVRPKPNTTAAAPRAGKWWTGMQDAINARAKTGDVDLVFLGDSITQGWHDDEASKAVWNKFYGSRKAMNAGIGGDQTQHVLWRIDNGNLAGLQPKVAVLMIGTNNSGVNTSAEIADGIKAIVARLREKLPATKVLVLGIFPRGESPDDPKRQVNDGVNAIIAKLADGKHVFYLDFGAKFLKPDGAPNLEVMPDKLHLNGPGYQIWAESMESKLAELLGEKS